MARTARNAKIDTRSARVRLPARREPYWTAIAKGRALGYRKGAKGGSWIARWRDPKCQQHYKALGPADDILEPDGETILSFGQAQERAREWFSEIVRPRKDLGPYLVRHAVEDYLKDYTARGGKAVVDAQKRADAHILPELGNVAVSELSTERLEDWLRKLAASAPRARTRKGGEQRYRDNSRDPEAERRRRSTANRTMTLLKAALNFAWKRGKANSDEAWRRVKPFREADAARVRYLSSDEVTRLVNACQGPFRDLVQGALFTGARYGELVRFRASDFNPDAGTLTVRTSKSGKARHIVLTAEGVAFCAAIMAGKLGEDLIFARDNGLPWGPSHQQRPLTEACRRAAINPAANFHSLRHTYASHLAMRRVPLPVLATNLGHSDTRMVEKHYGHLAPSFVADAIRAAGLGYEVPMSPLNVVPFR